ncbi:MAG: zinc-dependent metalloprotease, partial [Acidimicrobiia bacterium]|nr:zinc-dependent metalloprotease [Acidimicrobiia bacterium]
IPVCVKVLVDSDGLPVVPLDRVRELMDGARSRFEQCNIELCVGSIEMLTAPEGIEDFTCSPGGFLSANHLFFEDNSCSNSEVGVVPLTIFFVPDYEGSKGCAMSQTNYIVVGADASLATVAHEIGHQADLLHRETPTNVMMNGTTDASVDFTRWQCCMIRSARFSTAFPVLACRGISVDRLLATSRRLDID